MIIVEVIVVETMSSITSTTSTTSTPSVLRYTPERVKWEDEKQKITALEMGINIWEENKKFKNIKTILDTWKIGMIQGLIESDIY